LNKKLQNIDISVGKLLNTLRRFPVALFSAYLFTIILMTLATLNYPQKEALLHYNIINKVSFLASIGFFLFTTLRLISRNYLLVIFGCLLLLSYYIYLPENIRNLDRLAMEYPLIIFSLLLLMIASPYLTRSTSNLKFWNWAKYLIFSLLLSAVFGFILFMGLNGGLYITEKLFTLGHTHRYVEQIGLFTVGIFGSYFFLSQLPKYPRLLPVNSYNHIEEIFTKFILTPLFALYFIILYSYTAKILFLGEWPKGVVSIAILLFSALSILTYLFWTPLWNRENQKYKNLFWWAILLQTFVLAIALYLRVEPYGWTSSRYFIGVLGFWLFVISLYFIFYKKASYRTIFISLPVLLMLALFSPFSANAIAQKSQQGRLIHLLSQESNLSEESNLSLRYNISSSIEYLYEKHGIESLFPIFPEIVTAFENRDNPIDKKNCISIPYKDFSPYVTEKLGFNYIDQWQWEEHNRAIAYRKFKAVDTLKTFTRLEFLQHSNFEIKGYDWFISFNYFKEDENYPKYCPPINNSSEKKIISKPKFFIETKKNTIEIKEKNRLLATIDLKAFIHKIVTTKKEIDDNQLPTYYNESIRFSKKEFTYLFNNNLIMAKIIFDKIEASENEKIFHYQGNILIKKK